MKTKDFFVLIVLLTALFTACKNPFLWKEGSGDGIESSGSLVFVPINGGIEYEVGPSPTMTGHVEIPAKYNGKSVVRIGEMAFFDNRNITGVTIPDSIKSIGHAAFNGCSKLAGVTIPNSVTTIEASAFGGSGIATASIGSGANDIQTHAFGYCFNLTAITVNSANNSYASDNGVLYNKGKTRLVVYPAGKAGASFTIPPAVTGIEMFAFAGNNKLTGITIGAGVANIETNAFISCINLAAITVNGSNTNYSSDGGVLYNKAGTTLITYPAGKAGTSFTIPAIVTTINTYAFMDVRSLTTINMGDNIADIYPQAFAYCYTLTTITVSGSNSDFTSDGGILYDKSKETLLKYPEGKTGASFTIPGTVTTVGYSAVENVMNLTSVTIPNTVTKIEEWAFRSWNLKTVTFSSGSSISDGNFNQWAFIGDLKTKYLAGGAGTYKTPGSQNSDNFIWTKQ
ncbi:MAG: leucine-rich repeat domain-containing protein [Treponema sp.]|jgi:hypothetical protein|nr:leucine-rich repeat domain-containing protein [Treponema sp.]